MPFLNGVQTQGTLVSERDGGGGIAWLDALWGNFVTGPESFFFFLNNPRLLETSQETISSQSLVDLCDPEQDNQHIRTSGSSGPEELWTSIWLNPS